jgi:hypothetical protein
VIPSARPGERGNLAGVSGQCRDWHHGRCRCLVEVISEALRPFERLAELEAARAAERQRQRVVTPVNSPEQMRALLGQLRERWFSGQLAVQERKELLRCVIEQVRLATDGKVVRAEVVWQGGARSQLDVPKYLGASSSAYHVSRRWRRPTPTPRSPSSSMPRRCSR